MPPFLIECQGRFRFRVDRERDLMGEALPTCPQCKVELRDADVRLVRFDCPRCGVALKPIRRATYVWVRALVCCGAAFFYAWLCGWNSSFVIFVVSCYALPAFVVWSIVERVLFRSKNFESAESSIQTLGI
jgi:predicted RNA-binding Zn-ribbon protein involved in translation (DUF1610 family)